MSNETAAQDLAPGDSVADREDDDPNEGIVVWRPTDRTIADWEYETDEGTTTTAEENPDYPADEQLVVVAYRDSLADEWPAWEHADPDDLYPEVVDSDVNLYGFPASRLRSIEPGELDAQWLDGLADRLEDAGWTVTRNPTTLVVERFGEEYRIEVDGSVEGEGEHQTPLATLVENYRE